MDKKELKWYETPAMEVVELNAKTVLLVGSDPDDVKDDQVIDLDQ